MKDVPTQTRFPLMPRFRFSLAAALLAALFASAPALAGGADPARFVTSIYAHGREEATFQQWTDGGKRGAWLSRDLTALWNQCDASARKSKPNVCALDFDVAENSQMGWEAFKGFTVSLISQGGGHAVVDARLKVGHNTAAPKFDSDNVIHYDLVQEGGAWKIDEVRSTTDGKPWSLRALLKDYLKA
jgi:hypothetical protein